MGQCGGLWGDPHVSPFGVDGKCRVKQWSCLWPLKESILHFLLGKVIKALLVSGGRHPHLFLFSHPQLPWHSTSTFLLLSLLSVERPSFHLFVHLSIHASMPPCMHPSIQHSVSISFAHTLVQLLGSEEEAAIERGDIYPNK